MLQPRFSVRLLLAGLLLVAPALGSAQPFRVEDITTASSTPPPPPFGEHFVTVGGLVYFAVDDGIHGAEIWRSDGTQAGTFLLKDVCPGICSASPKNLVAVGDKVFFDTRGLGIWRSDGTAEGTVKISDIQALELEELAGSLYFTGFSPTEEGHVGIWKSDGTAAGTALIELFDWSYGHPVFVGKAGGLLFLSADVPYHGRELLKTDGTPEGTGLVKDINPGNPDSLQPLSRYTAPDVGGRLFFRAFTPATGNELWVSDGTAAGTYMVADLVPGPASGISEEMVAFGGQLLFLAADELWRSDGTAAGTVRLLEGDGLWPLSDLTVAGSLAFFKGGDAGHGLEVWKTDGTVAGTARVADIVPGPPNSLYSPSEHSNGFNAAGDRLVFFANDGTAGDEPWASDGTQAGTLRLADVNPGAAGSFRFSGYRPDRGVSMDGTWFFGAYTHPGGWALWSSDGTPAGTSMMRRFPTQWSSVRNPVFTDFGGTLFFDAREEAGNALWRSDGSEAGTSRVKLLGGADFDGKQILPWNGDLFYSNGFLWKSDGTEAGTGAVDATPGSLAYLRHLTPTPSFLFYQATVSNANELELWAMDGTTPEKVALSLSTWVSPPVAFRDGVAFADSALVTSDGTLAEALLDLRLYVWSDQTLANVGGRLFFFAFGLDAGAGLEPWVSDNTVGGTRLLRDIRPGPFGSMANDFYPASAVLGERWFFLADDGVSGEELWVSDGTTPGTRRVKDIRPGTGSSRVVALTAGRDRVWFTADDGVHGEELWVSDGSEAGTRMVRDIMPGAGTSSPRELTAVGHLLLFSAFDPAHGIELWRSDGTEAGTVRVHDIAAGTPPSSPHEITAAGPYVYFSANDGITGFEPWALERTALGGFLTATKSVSGRPFPGRTLTYTIAITNVGAGPHPDRPGDEMVDVLPSGLTLVGAAADSGSIATDLPARRVSWNGALPVGGTATVTVVAMVEAARGTVLRNQAALSFDADGDGTGESAGVSDAPRGLGEQDATDVLVTSGPLSFYTVAPCRVLDTRAAGGTPLASGVVRTFALAGSCGIPADAEAVAANLTTLDSTAPGFVSLGPAGAPMPGTSTLNFVAGALRSNNATLTLSGAGSIDVRAALFGGPSVHLILDVNGYYRSED